MKTKLKSHSNWFLIYDNVEKFNEILDYFPHNPEIWGTGRVIITTRDGNIRNNNQILAHNFIDIKELNNEEKISLFTSILYNNNPNNKKKLDSNQNEVMKEFLKEVSPYPLDIVTAAYYLKDVKITYAEYLQRLNTYNKNFDKIQKIIIKENSGYDRTRNGIIRLTLNKIIEEHAEFKELLLYISLLDSQHIPRALLDDFKNNALVDQFMHTLRRHSLIVSPESSGTFSLHRSTQEISLAFLKEHFNLNKNSILLKNISEALEKYIDNKVESEDFSRMPELIIHCEKFLEHKQLLAEFSRAALLSKLATMHFYSKGDLVKARQYLELALKIFHNNENFNNKINKHNEKNIYKIAWAMQYLGIICESSDNYEKAKALFEQSIVMYKKLSCNEQKIAQTLGYLALVYRDLGNYEKMKEFLEKSLEYYEKQPIKNHSGISRVLVYLGVAHRDLGNYDKAKLFLEQGLLEYRKYSKEDDSRVDWMYGWLGRIYKEAGDFDKAIQFLEQSLTIRKKYFSENKINIAWTQGQLGNAYTMAGQFDRAKELLESALNTYKKYPNNVLGMAGILEDLGVLYRKLGNFNEARDLLQNSMVIMEKHAKNPHWQMGALAELGIVYQDLGEYEKARFLLEKCITISKKNLTQNPVWVAQYLGYLGNIYRDLGLYDDAKVLLEQTLSTYENIHGHDHLNTAWILKNLGQLYLLQSELDLAESFTTKSLMIYQKKSHPESYLCLEQLSLIYLKKSLLLQNSKNSQQLKLKKQAIAYLKQSELFAKKYLPENSAHRLRIKVKLATLK